MASRRGEGLAPTAEAHSLARADFPYDGPNPSYGTSTFDEKNQVYYCLVDNIRPTYKDAPAYETRLIGINVQTANIEVDVSFPCHPGTGDPPRARAGGGRVAPAEIC